MKPIALRYANFRSTQVSPNLEYDYNCDLNRVNGKIFVHDDGNVLSSMTKTDAVPESDDQQLNLSLLVHMTKTFTVRESDDDIPPVCPIH